MRTHAQRLPVARSLWLLAGILFVGMLCTAAAWGQGGAFEPAGGPLSALVPAVGDELGDGPDSGDEVAWFRWEDRQNGIVGIQTNSGPIGFLYGSSNGGIGSGILNEYGLGSQSPLFVFDMAMGGEAMGGTYNDGLNEVGLMLQDAGGDGVYESLLVTLTTRQASPMVVPLITRDTDGDGVPDYVAVGGLATLLAPCTGCGVNSPDNQIWLPMAPTSMTTKSVVLDLDADGGLDPEFLNGPPLVRIGESIPTLGQWGLLLLILAVVSVGLRTVRSAA